MALSSDGKVLVTGGREDRAVKAWNTHTGQLICLWSAVPLSPYRGKNGIPSLSLNSNGTVVIAGGCSLKAWNTDTGKQIRAFKGSTSWTSYVTASNDDQFLITENWGGVEARISVWNMETGKLIRSHSGTISVMWVISPDSEIVAGEDSLDKSLKIWDLKTGEVLRSIDNMGAIRVSKLAFSPTGRWLAGGGFDGIKIWDTYTGQQVQTIDKFKNVSFHEHLDTIFSLAFTSDEKALLTTGRDGLVQAWDTCTGKNIGTLQKRNQIGLIALSKNAQTLVGFGSDEENAPIVEVWNVTQLA